MNNKLRSLSYLDAGVDIDIGNKLIDRISSMVNKTSHLGVLSNLGGFNGLFELPLNRYKNPVLVSGTDGVGTKLKIAMELKQYTTIGIDLVAMCINDIIVTGAEPLFFLDYYATGKLDIKIATQIISGITDGCNLSGAALIGGETAEMPGIYKGNEYDLAGFAVGIVDKEDLIDSKKYIKENDVLLGLASSGLHSNGYSLIHHILKESNIHLSMKINGQTLGQLLINPTRIYVKSLLSLIKKVKVHAIAHITGGGLLENLPRILPDNYDAKINLNSWIIPDIFQWLQTQGGITKRDMLRTFNCGIGMVIALAAQDVNQATELLEASGETVFHIGSVIGNTGKPEVIYNE